jgi:small subunit ribosomal protein S9
MTSTKKTEEKTDKAKKAPAAPKKAAAKKPVAVKAEKGAHKSPAKKAPAARPEAKTVAAAKPEEPAVVKAAETAVEEKAPAVKPAAGYLYAVGRRKTAVCQVRLWPNGKGGIEVNGKVFTQYFTTPENQIIVESALKAVGQDGKVDIKISARGGGLAGQAEAARLGITRALMKIDESYRKTLKKMGFVTRDPREKERKKYGLKKARKGPQWAKR